MHPYGKGNVLSVCFELAELVTEIGLEDQKILLENLFAALAGENLKVRAWNLPRWRSSERVGKAGQMDAPDRQWNRGTAVENSKCMWKSGDCAAKGDRRAGQRRVCTGTLPCPCDFGKEWIRIQIDRLDVWDLIVVEEERDGLVEEKAFSNDTK